MAQRVPINGHGRLLELTRCRSCGARGLEDPAIDPAPGLCPACFERELVGVFWFDLGLAEQTDPPLDQLKRAAGDPTLPGLDL